MPSKTRPAPKPVALLFSDGDGAIVTKTHDVEVAREVLLEHIRQHITSNDDHALEELQPYLDREPTLETGRWVCYGEWTASGEGRVWKTADPSGRGVTRAVVWYL